MNSIKDFLQTTIEGIVENSDAVSVSEETAQDTTQLLINVDDADMGRVIGKDGKVINSLRTIWWCKLP